ncbi:alanine racemase [Pantoea cypripedii]|uniref:Alanine racemase n=2 Tax=Pantoea cypripedii TaxID=55209 RepID=A0A1X1EZX6_PANCY|nr:D-serine deaminase-like pyridoxal phosphate-dependent protein [Pantoea cypripedii]ORM95542.1 alanine racemase [Pantoea cypripedii]
MMEHDAEAGWLRPLIADRLTPFLEIDAARLLNNLQQMQQKADAAGVALRPHIKTHKSVWIARQQRALGARGITVSKPSEGVAFILGGERDLLLAYPIVYADTLTALLQVAAEHQARITCIADSLNGVAAIAAAHQQQPSADLAIAIKVDVGLHRVGVDPHSDAALTLAAAITAAHLPFAGLVSHAGHAYGAGHPAAIGEVALEEIALMRDVQQRLIATGFAPCPVSVGSTPTALAAPVAPGTDEIRPGNYALLDLTAWRLGLCSPDALALSVVTRVVAVNPHYAIIDAGSKMLSSDKGPHGTNASGFGIAVDEHGNQFEVVKLSEEHGFLQFGQQAPSPGTLLRIFPNHSCAVVAQSDHFVLRHADGLAEVLNIEGRGKFI